MQLTVAICTHNPTRDTLARVLDAINDQLATVDPPAEVIVVDNNSEPPLRDDACLTRRPIILLEQPVPGLTAARETVFENARGDVILFVDDDNVLCDGYLSVVVENFTSDPELGLLGGAVVPEYETTPPAWFGEFEGWLAVRRYGPEFQLETTAPPWTEHFPIGAGLAVRREVALAYVADCAATTRIQGRRGAALSSGEDLDLGLFALSQGKKLRVTGQLVLLHVIGYSRLKPEYLERLATSNVRSSLAIEDKWGRRLGQKIYPVFGVSTLGLCIRFATARTLGIVFPRFRIKSRVFQALINHRLGRSV